MADEPALEMDDKELYDNAVSDKPPEAEPDKPTEEATGEQPRNEKGQFAQKDEKPEAQVVQPQVEKPVETPPEKPEDAQVPSWRLREVREDAERRQKELSQQFENERSARLRTEAQIQQLMAQQQPAKAPNIFEEPDNWQAHLTQSFQGQIQGVRFQTSEMIARSVIGDQKVNEAIKWLEGNLDPATQARISNSQHPYAEMVKVYDERKTLTEIGGDLAAYKQKLLDEALNDPEFMKKVGDKLRQPNQPGSKNIVQVPPSLSRAGSTGTHTGSVDLGDMSDASLYKHAIS